jgi:hypothetical protein
MNNFPPPFFLKWVGESHYIGSKLWPYVSFPFLALQVAGTFFLPLVLGV